MKKKWEFLHSWWETPQWIYTSHVHALPLAKFELHKAFGVSAKSLCDGLLLADFPMEGGDFRFQEAEEKTLKQFVFNRHRQPVHGIFDLGHDSLDLPYLLKFISERIDLEDWPKDLALRVSVRAVNSKLGVSGGVLARFLREKLPLTLSATPNPPHFNAAGEMDLQGPRWHLMLTVRGQRVYWGVGDDSKLLSPRFGGAVHFSIKDLEYSRAAGKLLEAFEVFNISELCSSLSLESLSALDLGAAPGGWTGVLLKKGFSQVVAVDPSPLDAKLQRDPRVHHLKQKAHECEFKAGTFNLVVCDANWSLKSSVETLLKHAHALKPAGCALLTLKLMGSYQRTGEASFANSNKAVRGVFQEIQDALKLLEANFDLIGARQLFHNRHEISVFLRKNRL